MGLEVQTGVYMGLPNPGRICDMRLRDVGLNVRFWERLFDICSERTDGYHTIAYDTTMARYGRGQDHAHGRWIRARASSPSALKTSRACSNDRPLDSATARPEEGPGEWIRAVGWPSDLETKWSRSSRGTVTVWFRMARVQASSQRFLWSQETVPGSSAGMGLQLLLC